MTEDGAEVRTRLAAYALCLDEGRVLLCRIAPGYPGSGDWTLPGGGVHFGEDPADTVIRELAEETGLSGTILSIAFVHSGGGVNEGTVRKQPWHGVRIVYHVDVIGGELRDEIEDSTDRAAWVPVPDADQLPFVDMVGVALDHLRALDQARNE